MEAPQAADDEGQAMLDALNAQYDDMISWAEMYDSASMEVSVKTNNVASYQSESPMPKSRGLEPHQNTRFGKCLRQAHPVSLPFCYSLYLLKSIQSTAGRLLSP